VRNRKDLAESWTESDEEQLYALCARMTGIEDLQQKRVA